LRFDKLNALSLSKGIPQSRMRVNLRGGDGLELARRGWLEASEDEGVLVLHQPFPFFGLLGENGFGHRYGEVHVEA